MLRPYKFAPAACYFLFKLAMFVKVDRHFRQNLQFCAISLSFSLRTCFFGVIACHFRFDLAIFNLSNFGLVACHYRFEVAMFTLRDHHFHSGRRIAAGARNFCRDHASIAPVACHSRLDLAIFPPVACHFRLDLAIFALAAARHFCLDLVIFVPLAFHFRFNLLILTFRLLGQ